MTNNDKLWAKGEIPYNVAVKRELVASGVPEDAAIKLMRVYKDYTLKREEMGRQPSVTALDILL